MPRYYIIFLLLLLLAACDSNTSQPKGRKYIIPEKEYPTDKEYTADLPPPPAPYTGPKKYCFEKQEGENGEDKTELQVVLDNDSIYGRMDYLFAKRPAIHGQVEGIVLGSVLSFILSYSSDNVLHQERMTCKFEGDKLFKKSGPMYEKDSVMELQFPSKAVFVLFMERTKCP